MFEEKFGRIIKTKVTFDGKNLIVGNKQLDVNNIKCIYTRPFSLLKNQWPSIYISTDGKDVTKPTPTDPFFIEYTKNQKGAIDNLIDLLGKDVIDKQTTNDSLGHDSKKLDLEILSDSKNEFKSGIVVLSYIDEGVTYLDNFFKKSYETQYEIVETVVTSKLDTETKKKWLGRAIVGNIILPGAGAIVGAMTAKEKEIIKGEKSTAMIVLKSKDDQSIRRIVVKVTPKNEYLIDNLPTAEQQDSPTPLVVPEKSNIDQLKEYKELLDLDIISQSEFENKKKELLS